MTSGTFHSVELSSIIINREGRQRRELTDLPELAESIGRIGLINPVVVTRDLILVAGERRLEACRSLGWTHIHAHFTDELSDPELRVIELEENVKRSALPWQDECKAILEYHDLRKAEAEEWSIEDTGKALGISQATVSQKISVAKEIISGNDRVAEAPRYSVARGITERKAARLDEEALGELKTLAKIEKPIVEEFPDSILNRDFNEWAPSYDGPKFNFIHCDFPYGIDANKFNQGAASLHGGYDDDEGTYWKLCRTLSTSIPRLCTDSCHLVFWFSLHYYHDTLEFFNTHTDFILDPFPLIWLKSDNIGIIPDAERGPRRIYETAFFGSRGDRKIVRAKSNAYAAPTVRDVHMSVKPEPVLRHFFEMFVDESTIMLDPTCGSGSSIRAAEGLGASHVLGLEINKEFHIEASKKLRSARLMKNAGK